MYVASVIALTVVLPIISVIADWAIPGGETSLTALVGAWFVFWTVGVRLSAAGIMQVIRPSFTVKNILGNEDAGAAQIAQELGFANVAIGVLGIVAFFVPDWIPAAALAGALFLGLAGIRHIVKRNKNVKEWVATLTDLFVFVVLAWYLITVLVGR